MAVHGLPEPGLRCAKEGGSNDTSRGHGNRGPCDDPGPTRRTVSQILQVVETLPKNQREVIYLKFQSDLSYKEISEVTKLSVSNVGFLIHSAVRAIRKQMLLEAPQATTRRTQ